MIFSGLSGKIGTDLINLYSKKVFNRDYFELDFSVETESKTIVHMAACSNIDKNKKIINSNIKYLNEIINYANKNKVENFIFFSAVSVYGRGGV
ncbi:hypothetical protein CFT12S02225_08475 [Campylobacter fetus subsp. testudinum]|uniref:NAD-dependent epimerase/dehydratase domain-containing protein n=1 Tax=Campylobacter fetus subsp. testudinum TaxID=1507806 RepID=A0AAX0H9K1_CAMFE|nr:NAD-dependent epimerase/dehydratase family protein [Campylobacter fetus]OCR90138.1 hypothetical protein CFT12S02225_08475 [Campylobacter fetus subsp. testudinum]